MKKDKILDSKVHITKYNKFSRCTIESSGKVFKFRLVSGMQYIVPLDYIKRWFCEPHYILKNGRWVDWEDLKLKAPSFNNAHIVRHRVCRDKHVVRIYLSNNTAFDVVWDVLLMFCDKRYEHFGGFRAESKKLARKHYKVL